MDPISYGVAAKQKQRIEKVIAEPDSTSGVITVPKVIATGETITIPTGRTAVLPNTTVNGTLVVDGEVFIPSGSSYTATSINVNGNILVTGSGGLGYGTGAGGTVTQLTSKSTAITLNKPTGRITMNNASLASGATVIFQVNNSLVTTNDTVYVNAIDNDHYDVTTGWTSNSAFVIIVKNTTAGALAEALQIQFTVTKGAVA